MHIEHLQTNHTNKLCSNLLVTGYIVLYFAQRITAYQSHPTTHRVGFLQFGKKLIQVIQVHIELIPLLDWDRLLPREPTPFKCTLTEPYKLPVEEKKSESHPPFIFLLHKAT
jgi:hypothetical protein